MQVIIRTELTDRIVRAVERCTQEETIAVQAYRKETMSLLDQQEILRVHTENRKLIICTENGPYESRKPLRELEADLDSTLFVRISRFEIINIRKAVSFDFSNTGTIRVIFTDGSETWVARRYMQALREALRKSAGRRDGHA